MPVLCFGLGCFGARASDDGCKAAPRCEAVSQAALSHACAASSSSDAPRAMPAANALECRSPRTGRHANADNLAASPSLTSQATCHVAAVIKLEEVEPMDVLKTATSQGSIGSVNKDSKDVPVARATPTSASDPSTAQVCVSGTGLAGIASWAEERPSVSEPVSTFVVADFPGFKKLSASVGSATATWLVDRMDYAFDELCKTYKMQRMQTTSRRRPFMACAADLTGDLTLLDSQTVEDVQAGAVKALCFAKDLQTTLRKVLRLPDGLVPARIGLTTGPCSRGDTAADSDKVDYDAPLFDTAVAAINVQRSCMPDRIQACARTVQHLQSSCRVSDWEPSGSRVQVGGGAVLNTFLWQERLAGPRTSAASPRSRPVSGPPSMAQRSSACDGVPAGLPRVPSWSALVAASGSAPGQPEATGTRTVAGLPARSPYHSLSFSHNRSPMLESLQSVGQLLGAIGELRRLRSGGIGGATGDAHGHGLFGMVTGGRGSSTSTTSALLNTLASSRTNSSTSAGLALRPASAFDALRGYSGATRTALTRAPRSLTNIAAVAQQSPAPSPFIRKSAGGL